MASETTSNKIWLITGASSGLGQAMGLAALRDGHRVIGTGRNISRASKDFPEFEKLGGRWLQLDISQSTAIQNLEEMVKQEEAAFTQPGPVHWVVVNNAAYSLMGTVKEASEGQLLSYMDTNVLGTIRVWKAMIPTLRRHRTGTVITISSLGSVILVIIDGPYSSLFGMVGKGEQMMYSAVKAATESLTESYCELLPSFGIKTFIVQPGAFRTKFAGNSIVGDGEVPEDYKETMKRWLAIVDAVAADSKLVDGSPEKFGEAVVDAVQDRGLFEGLWVQQDPREVLRIQLGSDSFATISQKVTKLANGLSKTAEIAKSTDYDGTGAPKQW